MPTASILVLSRRVNNSWPAGLTKAELSPSMHTTIAESIRTAPNSIQGLFNRECPLEMFNRSYNDFTRISQLKTFDSYVQQVRKTAYENEY